MPAIRQARDRLLAAAVELESRHGVAGTTVAELLKVSGVARRSLYMHFANGRDDVVTEATAVAGQAFLSDLRSAASALCPARALDAIVERVRVRLVETDFDSSCPVLAAGLGGQTVPGARVSAGQTFLAARQQLAGDLEGNGVPAAQAASIAGLILASVEGAQAIGVATRSTDFLDDVRTQLSALLLTSTQTTATNRTPE
ncbi:MAG TPA: TetR/AcrR family transcriptional regulator [Vicinamibacterales bacterium]|jgi:AcrR family transcriptional regulator|nr:TetR/AcrR family transcriptional regulator [Vicinamibacterales bacterium]